MGAEIVQEEDAQRGIGFGCGQAPRLLMAGLIFLIISIVYTAQIIVSRTDSDPLMNAHSRFFSSFDRAVLFVTAMGLTFMLGLLLLYRHYIFKKHTINHPQASAEVMKEDCKMTGYLGEVDVENPTSPFREKSSRELTLESQFHEESSPNVDEDIGSKQIPVLDKTDFRATYLDNLKLLLIFIIISSHPTLEILGLDSEGLYVISWTPSREFLWLVAPILPFEVGAMPLFFFISGLFTIDSFERKGFREFLTDRLTRLVIPMLLVMWLLFPLVFYILYTSAGIGFRYTWELGHTWFLLHLALANVMFAFVWRFTPGSIDSQVGHWLERTLIFDRKLYLWAILLFPVAFIEYWYARDIEILTRTAILPGDTFLVRLSFFYVGVYAGQVKWMRKLEELCNAATASEKAEDGDRARTRKLIHMSIGILVLAMAGCICLVTLATSLDVNGLVFDATWNVVIFSLLSVILIAALVILTLFAACRWLNEPSNRFTRFLTQSMYTVYVIHPIITSAVSSLWFWILQQGFGIPLEFLPGERRLLTQLSVGTRIASVFIVWLGLNFTVWPLAYVVRKLPLLNKVL